MTGEAPAFGAHRDGGEWQAVRLCSNSLPVCRYDPSDDRGNARRPPINALAELGLDVAHLGEQSDWIEHSVNLAKTDP
jgi:hypothetical protein